MIIRVGYGFYIFDVVHRKRLGMVILRREYKNENQIQIEWYKDNIDVEIKALVVGSAFLIMKTAKGLDECTVPVCVFTFLIVIIGRYVCCCHVLLYLLYHINTVCQKKEHVVKHQNHRF